MRIVGMWLSALTASLLSLKFLPGPYIWIFLVWSGTFMYTTRLGYAGAKKILWFNLSAILLILTITEAYYFYVIHLSHRVNTHTFDRVYEEKKDTLLGYVSIPDTQRIARELYQDKPIYEVNISINSDGYRISPPYAPSTENNQQSILFFGCSFTYGEGVNDHETMPYMTGLLTNGQNKIYNFGLYGYGPQQMLAAIDHDVVDAPVDIQPRYIIYQALLDHVYRVAGYRWWLARSPQYILAGNGELIYSGSFNTCNPSHENCLWKRIQRNLEKSFLLQRFFLHQISPTDLDLFLKVVEHSKHIMAKKYPKAEFHVTFWHQPWNSVSKKMLKGLKQKSSRVHVIESIIPDIYKNNEFIIASKTTGTPMLLPIPK